jgi:RNA polymerase sigma-70 factor (ECF subfamily)
VQARLDKEAVVRALGSLAEEQRIAIVLMDLAGHTAAEVADMLRVPRGTVLARVHRGRRRLARVLATEGIGRDLP